MENDLLSVSSVPRILYLLQNSESTSRYITETQSSHASKLHIFVFYSPNNYNMFFSLLRMCGATFKVMCNLRMHMEKHDTPEEKKKRLQQRKSNPKLPPPPPGMIRHKNGKLYPRQRSFIDRDFKEDEDLIKLEKDEFKCKTCQAVIKGTFNI